MAFSHGYGQIPAEQYSIEAMRNACVGGNAADVLNSLQYIQDYGVNLICVEDGIDSSESQRL